MWGLLLKYISQLLLLQVNTLRSLLMRKWFWCFRRRHVVFNAPAWLPAFLEGNEHFLLSLAEELKLWSQLFAFIKEPLIHFKRVNLKALAKFQLNYCLPENSPIKLGWMYSSPPLNRCAAVAWTAKSFLGFVFKLAHFRARLRKAIHWLDAGLYTAISIC